MNAKIRRQLANRKRRIARRLNESKMPGGDRPVLSASNIHYEVGERSHGISYGGIGAMHLLVRQLGLAEVEVEGPEGGDAKGVDVVGREESGRFGKSLAGCCGGDGRRRGDIVRPGADHAFER